ncbi:MAG TPA: FAD:protein FMN transferase [Caulobacteraceae bacterium]|nr:FAD:protein FMN transferase [Caulobacteraceae bacterium]
MPTHLATPPHPVLSAVPEGLIYTFRAMASPCEVRFDSYDADMAARLGEMAEEEALRIERKYSRYRSDNLIAQINGAGGAPVEVDPETAMLLDYADAAYKLSRGLFDITSGVLRRIWKFDGSDRVPPREQVRAILPLVGWHKVRWRNPFITLLPGMEIDLGGLGKEYAVDITLLKLAAETRAPLLVNFGGDLRVSGPRAGFGRWRVAIESVDEEGVSEALLQVSQGALTTSGDARRFLLKDGVRYSHILNPRTGWPVKDAPRSVTVAAATCMEAGLMSTLAMLQGRGAEKFLRREGVQAWWMR